MSPVPFPSFELFLSGSNPFWLYLLSGSLLPILGFCALVLLFLAFISSFSSDADNRRVLLLAVIVSILCIQESKQNERRAAKLYGALYNRSESIEEFQKAKMEIISSYSNDDAAKFDEKTERLESLVKSELMNKPQESKGN